MTRLARRQKSRWVRLWKRRGYRYWGGLMVSYVDYVVAMSAHQIRMRPPEAVNWDKYKR